ncbi:MAG: metallophosphoesterase family protein [Brevinematia bacterium]
MGINNILVVIAVFSDVHSNLEALDVFISETYSKVDMYICLGDIIGYGPDPVVCINLVRSLCGTDWAIRGNHERAILDPKQINKFNFIAAEAIMWTIGRISDNEINYIKELSDIIDYDSYLFVHGGLIEIDEYIVSKNSAIRNLNKLANLKKNIMFFGHTHIPAIWSYDKFEEITFNEPIYLDSEKIYLINPGALGQPRDNIPLGSYLIFDDSQKFLVFKRFKYDIEKTYQKIITRGLPEYLGRRLKFGI